MIEEHMERIRAEERGKYHQRGKYDLHCIHCNRDGHDASTCKLSRE